LKYISISKTLSIKTRKKREEEEKKKEIDRKLGEQKLVDAENV